MNARLSSPMLAGMLTCMIFMLAGTLLVSLLMLVSGIKEQSLPLFSYAIHALAVFAGGIASGKRAASKGWSHGVMLGIVYAVVIMLISYLGFHSSLLMNFAALLGLSVVFGALGGIIGVNLSNR